MEKRWSILEADRHKVELLHQSLPLSLPLRNILVQRGIDTFEKAKDFFRPALSGLHDPFLMKDMDKAVKRILQAIDQKENILLYGDYDVDGTCAVAVMYRFLSSLCDPKLLSFYIPHRHREGYGISKAGIDEAITRHADLVITLDCGIKSIELITYGCTLGLDFIVCDHHLPGDQLPPAMAILNPKQMDCSYPYKELCGCAVGFKLIMAICHHLGFPEEKFLSFIDLVAVATGADIVPVTGENRILAYHGLQKLNTSPCAGLKALIPSGLTGKPLSIHQVIFMLAPSINAAGRMDDATKVVRLLIEDDLSKASELAKILGTHNLERRDIDTFITQEALSMITSDPAMENKNTTVVYAQHWHKGVVGIVASRLIESYHRPTVVLTLGDQLVSGSARSIPGFNLYEAIHSCRDLLESYGGHFAAAGLSLLPENVEAFTTKFEEVVTATIDPQTLAPTLAIDTAIGFSSISKKMYTVLEQMEPFGPCNRRPVFITRGVTDTGRSAIVKEDHLRLLVINEGITLAGIGFNLAGKFPLLNRPFDLVYTLGSNVWKGETSLQLQVLDIRLSRLNSSSS